MRIEAYNQVQQLYQTKKVNKVRQTGGASQTDQLQFSNFGKEIRAAQAALSGVPDVREELIAPIRTRVQNGTYNVDTTSFADKLMEKASAMDMFNEEMR